jgi:hypothetical protein
MSAVGNFFHKIGAAGAHILQWVTGGGAKKVVVETEKLVLEAETWIGSNEIAKTYLKPLTDKLVSGIEDLGKQALADLGSGASLDQIVAHVSTGVPALMKSTETAAVAEVKGAVPTAHTSTIMTLVNFAYAVISPRLPQIIAGILGIAL